MKKLINRGQKKSVLRKNTTIHFSVEDGKYFLDKQRNALDAIIARHS
jgi:hypothetical protein